MASANAAINNLTSRWGRGGAEYISLSISRGQETDNANQPVDDFEEQRSWVIIS